MGIDHFLVLAHAWRAIVSLPWNVAIIAFFLRCLKSILGCISIGQLALALPPIAILTEFLHTLLLLHHFLRIWLLSTKRLSFCVLPLSIVVITAAH
jgi:hypothetical protein